MTDVPLYANLEDRMLGRAQRPLTATEERDSKVFAEHIGRFHQQVADGIETDASFRLRLLDAPGLNELQRYAVERGTGRELDEVGFMVGKVRIGLGAGRVTSMPFFVIARDFELPYPVVLYVADLLERGQPFIGLYPIQVTHIRAAIITEGLRRRGIPRPSFVDTPAHWPSPEVSPPPSGV